jgi:hypothetical protein
MTAAPWQKVAAKRQQSQALFETVQNVSNGLTVEQQELSEIVEGKLTVLGKATGIVPASTVGQPARELSPTKAGAGE